MPNVSEKFFSWARNTQSQNIWIRKDTESILFLEDVFPFLEHLLAGPQGSGDSRPNSDNRSLGLFRDIRLKASC